MGSKNSLILGKIKSLNESLENDKSTVEIKNNFVPNANLDQVGTMIDYAQHIHEVITKLGPLVHNPKYKKRIGWLCVGDLSNNFDLKIEKAKLITQKILLDKYSIDFFPKA